MKPKRIVLRGGGWFVIEDEETGELSGPWRTKEAAELAAKGEYRAAAHAERVGKATP